MFGNSGVSLRTAKKKKKRLFRLSDVSLLVSRMSCVFEVARDRYQRQTRKITDYPVFEDTGRGIYGLRVPIASLWVVD